MNINRIKNMIRDAFEDEQQYGRLANLVQEVAHRNDRSLTDQQVKSIVDFVKEYVQHVPLYLEQGIKTAQQAGLGREMNQMAIELEAYWKEEADLIPDHLGLLGILDDAYATLLLLQSLSDYCKNTVGQPILAQDLTSANQMIRQLIGEPIASQLDQRVGITLSQSLLNKIVGQFAMNNFLFGATDPYWQSDYEREQWIDTQLGAMGIV